MLKISLLFNKLLGQIIRKFLELRMRNLHKLFLYEHKHIGDFQICISVPLNKDIISLQLSNIFPLN